MKPNESWSDSVRRRFGGRGTSSQAPVRRLSRRDQEARYQRVFYLTMAGVAGLIALILGIGAFYEYQIKPNAVLAEVNGHEISRRDYWQYQSVVLYQQARTYESFAMQTSGQQQQQFLQFAASFDAQRDDVWGSTDVSSATLQQMIDDRLYLDGAEALGIQVSEEEAAAFALNQFAPPDAPLTTPLPSPTMIPERAQMATETANAMATEQAIAMGTPVASPIASPGAGTPAATPQATPISSETPASTPNMEDARTAAEAEYEIFQDNVFEEANMSEEDYIRLWARPQLARQLVDHQLTSQVPQVAEQVNAQHILVATQDLANQLHGQATGGADFGQLARSSSTDTITAPTGGQLGWFTRLEMDPAFAEAAFALEPGQISEPVQTPFGWHIIRAIEKDPERALTESQYNLATTETVDEWLELQRTESDVSSDHIESTPTPTPGSFVPPANAPTPVPATPVPMTPTPTPPLVGPVPVTPDATPAGSPAAAPGSTPIATPAGTPEVPAVG